MNQLLHDLYDYFYSPPELSVQKQEIEECHQALIERLDKPERRLVLRIIDAKDRIAEDTSIDSFISGFELAWQLSIELNQYEKERSVSRFIANDVHPVKETMKKHKIFRDRQHSCRSFFMQREKGHVSQKE